MSPVAQGSVVCVVSKGGICYTVVVIGNYMSVVFKYLTKKVQPFSNKGMIVN